MSRFNNTPNITVHAPISMNQLVKEGYITIDACAFMHPHAIQFIPHLITELQHQKRRIWESADVLAELQRNAHSIKEDTCQAAYRGLRLYQLMVDAGVLDTYSDTPDTDQVRDHKNRPVFADNVIVARTRMFSSIHPCTVITFDRSLTAVLLSKPDYDCDTRSGQPVRVYRFDEAGQPCPVTLSVPPSAAPASNTLPSDKPAPRSRQHTVLPFSQLVPLTHIENAPIAHAPLGDSVTGVRTGRSYTLGKQLGFGTESEVYAVEGNDTLAVKTFLSPTIHKIAKVSLLCDQHMDLPDAALPIEEIVNPVDGNVIGYAMPRMHGVSLEVLLNARGQQRHMPNATRKEYVRMALSLVVLADTLLQKGVLLADINAKNFIVAKNSDGTLNPDRVMAIDIDSAQFGNAKTGMFPAEGATPEYLDPQLLRAGVTDKTIRDRSSLSFSVTLLALQLVLAGIHPYRICGEDGNDEKSISDRIKDQRFPFGAGENHREAQAAPGAEYLWSHTTKAFKVYMASIFRSDGERCAPEKRPTLPEVATELRKLLYWLENMATDDDLSLNPTGYRAYTITCKKCGKNFDGNSHSADARKFCVCDECLSKPAGVCRDCGNPIEMTYGEMLRRALAHAPSRCKACYVRAQKPSAPSSVLLYTKCPVCGNAHKTGQPCPVCAAARKAAADKAAADKAAADKAAADKAAADKAAADKAAADKAAADKAAADKAAAPTKAPSLFTKLRRIRWMP